MNIPDDQLAAAQQGDAVPFEALGTRFVILRSDIYDRVRSLVYEDGPWTTEERLAALKAAGERANWNDPELDVYEEYRPTP